MTVLEESAFLWSDSEFLKDRAIEYDLQTPQSFEKMVLFQIRKFELKEDTMEWIKKWNPFAILCYLLFLKKFWNKDYNHEGLKNAHAN